MSIFSQPPLTPDPSAVCAQAVRDLNTAAMEKLIGNFREAFGRIWHDSQVSPQEVFDQFGTSGAALFVAANATVTLISTVAASLGQTLDDYLKPEEYTPPLPYTINKDGTVTVGK